MQQQCTAASERQQSRMIRMLIVVSLASTSILGACASENGHANSASAPSTTPTTTQPPRDPTHAAPTMNYTGTLRGDMAGIGGESTGWALETVATDTGWVDVDISRVEAQAEALKGQRVTITGRIVQKRWVERGKQKLLIADLIVAAPK